MNKMVEENPRGRVAWEGCSALLDINDGDKLTFARLNSSATLKIGNMKCSLAPMIGCPFGALFQVERGPESPYLSRISASAHVTAHQDDEDEQNEEKTDDRDNRALIDNNTAQKLSAKDISEMRREGLSGDQIVEALIANSSTFHNKTAFSQEKYKRKKQKKYAPRALLRRPFSRSICEAYFNKCPAKIGFLRIDTLSLLLSLANVGAYSDVLVFDMVGGLVTGAVAERLGGNGYVCNTYNDLKPPPIDIVGLFNLDESTTSRIVRASLYELLSAHSRRMEQNTPKSGCDQRSMDASNMDTTSSSNDGMLFNVSKSFSEIGSEQLGIHSEKHLSHSMTAGELHVVEGLCKMQDTGTYEDNLQQNVPPQVNCRKETGFSITSEVRKSAKAGRRATSEHINLWAENGFMSLILAAPDLDPWTVIIQLLPLLSFSAPFAIYSQHLQPLAECMHKLQAGRMAVALQISEPWLREYQVLPSRTHPHMQMSSFGGYILSGIRICSSDNGQGEKS